MIHDFHPSALEAEAQVEASLIYLVSSRTAKAKKKQNKNPPEDLKLLLASSGTSTQAFTDMCTSVKTSSTNALAFNLALKYFTRLMSRYQGPEASWTSQRQMCFSSLLQLLVTVSVSLQLFSPFKDIPLYSPGWP